MYNYKDLKKFDQKEFLDTLLEKPFVICESYPSRQLMIEVYQDFLQTETCSKFLKSQYNFYWVNSK